MQRSKVFYGVLALLCSSLILLNVPSTYPAVYAQLPTPTSTVSQYVEITADNAQYLQSQLVIGTGTGRMPRWSPDGKQLAVAGSKGIWLMDAAALDQPPRQIRNSPIDIIDFAFSPNGTMIASVGFYDTTTLGDVRSATVYFQLWDLVHSSPITLPLFYGGIPAALAFSSDSKYLAYATILPTGYASNVNNDCIHILALNANFLYEVATFPCQLSDNSQAIWHLAFSPDSQWIVFGSKLGDVQVINLQTKQVISTTLLAPYPQSNSPVEPTFAPDSSKLILNTGGPARVILLPSGVQIASWQPQRDEHPIEGSLTYSDDGQRLYEIVTAQKAASTLKIWNTKDGQLLSTIGLPTTFGYGVSFQNPRNHTLILKRRNSLGEIHIEASPTFLVVDDQTGQIQFGFDGYANNKFSDLSPDGTRLAIMRELPIGPSSAVEVVDLMTRQQQRLPNFWMGGIGNYQFHPLGNILTVASSASIHFWDLHQKVDLLAIPYTLNFALSPNAKWLAEQVFASKVLNLYDFQSHRLLHTVELAAYVQHLAFTSDSRAVLVVTSQNDIYGVTRIDIASGTVTTAPAEHNLDGNGFLIGISADGLTLPVPTVDGVFSWNIETDSAVLLSTNQWCKLKSS